VNSPALQNQAAQASPCAVKIAPVIKVEGLTRVFRTYKKQPGLRGALHGLFHREYEQTIAANDVSFEIGEGELVGFLGPNGAGKTTVLKTLSGLLHPTSGHATVLGFVPWERRHEYRCQFALLLGQKNQLWWDLPARDSLELNSKIYGIPESEFRQTMHDLTEMLQVDDKLDVMVRELSLGERMKMELVAALLHRPRVLFLDEPTIGLDVVAQKIVREFLRAYKRKHKTTILLTSHYMADIEALCDRVLIIDRGKLFFDGALSEVLERFADSKTIEITTDRPNDTAMLGNFGRLGKVLQYTTDRVKLEVKRKDVPAACRFLLDRLTVADISIGDMAIEEVIRNIFRDARRPSASH
jgi:ABC-2 type transport system ATP-binding protein